MKSDYPRRHRDPIDEEEHSIEFTPGWRKNPPMLRARAETEARSSRDGVDRSRALCDLIIHGVTRATGFASARVAGVVVGRIDNVETECAQRTRCLRISLVNERRF